jgi:hypothetical protein
MLSGVLFDGGLGLAGTPTRSTHAGSLGPILIAVYAEGFER